MEKIDLSTQISKLSLKLAGSRVALAHAKLLSELAAKGLRFRPYIWISDDWFCPDGAAGFAVPFYLFDPELMKLEKKMMGRCEGQSERELMKLMRHECGHAIDNAFGLRRKKERQNLFGKSKTPYPKSYIPNLRSSDFVTHLGDGYAQAHPDEDWAETFALWLGTKDFSTLKRRYRSTKALDKIEYVDHLMKSLIGIKPRVSERWNCDPYRELEITLSRYYQKKKRLHIDHGPLFSMDELRRFAIKKSGGEVTRLLHSGLHLQIARKVNTSVEIAQKVVCELDKTLQKGRLGFAREASYTNKVLIDLLSKKTSQYLKEERNRIIM